MPDVAVVGSANVDRTVRVDHFPAPGQTTTGGEVVVRPGGKGANQAVAAARLGADVAMVAAVGDDRDGALLVESFAREGVDTTHVSTVDAVTGTAMVTVEAAGENTIVVSPGANGHLDATRVAAAAEVVAPAAVVLVQLEVPLDAVEAALDLATGVRVLNPAPAAPLAPEVLARVDVLVPNEGELRRLAVALDHRGPDDDLTGMARALGVATVVVTRGAAGALVVTHDHSTVVPAPAVTAVDTTGAGDSFCGALAAGLAGGDDLPSATRRAVVAASRSTTVAGARDGMPDREALAQALARTPPAGPRPDRA